MSFPTYPEYKDSGVEWLGQVPAHWGVERARTVGTFTASGIDKKTVEGEPVVRMINYSDVYKSISKTINFSTDLMLTTAAHEKVHRHALEAGDILLTPSSETSDDIGHAACVSAMPEAVVYSYHLIRFRPSPKNNSVYLTFAFNSRLVRSYFESVCTGTTRMVLVRDDFKNTPILTPPLPEQTAIAAFLDRETGKIDALIAEQQRLIELLQEKRQAVISHAVTKGLDPSVPMKDSGVEWLGEIPAHWTLSRVKRLSTLQRGYDLKRDDCEEGSVPVVTSSGITGTHSVSMASGPGVVTGRYGSTGRLFYIEEAFWPHNTTLFVCNFHGNNERFVWYSLHTVDFESHSDKAAVPGVDRNDIHILPVAIPSLRDQVAIAAYLDRHTSLIDSFAFQCQQAITLLQERRSALISAAVTGQIDVRAEAA